MININLVYPDKSNIKYTISKFPDGQQNIVLKPFAILDENFYYRSEEMVKFSINSSAQIKIISRLNDWKDLELIVCTVASLRELGVEKLHLYTPYIVGGRSDRKFEEGGNNYLKDVICPVINSLNFKTVTCIDPHSDVLEACLKNFRKIDNVELVNYALRCTYPEIDSRSEILKNIVLISPDAGANKKIYKVAKELGYNSEIITCSKERDTDGKLTKTVVPINDTTLVGKDFVIIDDICDGGATFINIAREIKKMTNTLPNQPKIYLIVTHGIFSKGHWELSLYFDAIYCTNSYSNVSYGMDNDKYTCKDSFVKQLNLFY